MRVLIAAAFVLPAGALAHDGVGETWWSFDPWTWAPMLAAAALYFKGLQLLARKPAPLRRAGFAAGMAALFLALVWPLDVLAERSLAAHMAQHMLLIAVAAPLLAFSDAARVLFRALPARRAFRKLLLLPSAGAAFALHAAAIWIGHAPLVIAWTLEYRWVHILEHAALLGTALVLWSALARLRAAGAGAAALYTLATMIHTGMLGALLTFAPRPLYAGATLEDQQLAGLIMWIPGGVAYLAIGLAFAAAWLLAAGAQSVTYRRPGAT